MPWRSLVLRETDPQTTIWELLLPEEAKRLPTELARVDAYLDDERFIAPWRGLFSARLGRPSVPVDTLLLLRARKLRVDTTVVEADIDYPTDADLLEQAVRKLGGLVRRIKGRGAATRTRFRDRGRAA